MQEMATIVHTENIRKPNSSHKSKKATQAVFLSPLIPHPYMTKYMCMYIFVCACYNIYKENKHISENLQGLFCCITSY